MVGEKHLKRIKCNVPIEQKNDLINIILFSSNVKKHFIIIPFLSFCLYSQTTLFKVEHEEIIMGEIVDELV